jgi:hypothetical protein
MYHHLKLNTIQEKKSIIHISLYNQIIPVYGEKTEIIVSYISLIVSIVFDVHNVLLKCIKQKLSLLKLKIN